MSRARATELLLVPVVVVVLFLRRAAWPVFQRVGRWPPLQRLRTRVARLPPALALTLFLVPEVCSRCGWAVSTVLLLDGHGWAALAVYAGTKLLAGTSALWVYAACEPALLRVRWFASLHAAAGDLRRAAWLRLRTRLPVDAVVARLRPPA